MKTSPWNWVTQHKRTWRRKLSVTSSIILGVVLFLFQKKKKMKVTNYTCKKEGIKSMCYCRVQQQVTYITILQVSLRGEWGGSRF